MKKIILIIFCFAVQQNLNAQAVYNGSSKHIFTTNYGNIEIGPFNTSWAHIYTDRPKIIFNKDVYTTTNGFSSYNNDLKLKTVGVTRLTINNDTGNVGIGLSSPQYKLQTSKGVQLRKTTIGVTSATPENSWIRDEWLTGSYGPAKWNQSIKRWVRPSGTYNDIGGIVYQDEGTYFLRDKKSSQLEYTNAEFLQTSFLFSSISTGNVGIGTTTPDSKLTVKGNIHAEEVKVDLSVPGPDYVFKEDYNLRTLEETQKYIKEHGHLPNIPSAKEMKENGVELGVMNMKLLEKIEELTLYVIQLKKENSRILALEKEMKSQKELLKKLEKLILKQ